MQYLISLNVWSGIRAISDGSQIRTAAVAYVTTEAMIRFGAGDVLVTDASDGAIACGETSAAILNDAIDRGAQVYSCKGLHAKVIVFDGIAVIGSANLSERSERDLVEAVWVTDNPTLVADARSFVQRLATQSQPIDRPFLQRILSIKVARRLPTLSKRDQNLNLDEQQRDRETVSLQPDADTIQPRAADPHIARALSRSRARSGTAWVLDSRLVLMDAGDVRTSSRFRRSRLAGERIWARRAELGTSREDLRSVPRPDYQILINAFVELAKAKRALPITDEILEVAVARYKSGKHATYYDRKPSRQLREDPLAFYGQYFHDATEESDRDGGKLKYFLHPTPERGKAFLDSIGLKAGG